AATGNRRRAQYRGLEPGKIGKSLRGAVETVTGPIKPNEIAVSGPELTYVEARFCGHGPERIACAPRTTPPLATRWPPELDRSRELAPGRRSPACVHSR